MSELDVETVELDGERFVRVTDVEDSTSLTAPPEVMQDAIQLADSALGYLPLLMGGDEAEEIVQSYEEMKHTILEELADA